MLNWMRWLPESASSYAADIDGILAVIYSLTLVWFFLTTGVLIFFLIRFRRRRGVGATYVQGERLREASWILVPCLIVLVLDFWMDFRGAPVWAKVKIDIPPTDFAIQVTAEQFNWRFVYPGPDGRFGTADDQEFENELRVPVNQPVRLELRSNDVIHSFFVPSLRLKQDIVPGRTIPAWFEAIRPGDYELVCAELCGFGHSGMKGWLYVQTPEEYRKWVKEQWPSS